MNVVSFDCGSSYSKIYSGPDSKCTVPTHHKLLATSSIAPDQEADIIWIDEKPYLVGHDAMSNELLGNLDPRIDASFHGSHDQYVHMCFLLNKIEAHLQKPDTLIVSLPFSETRDRNLVEKIRSRNTFKWRIAGEERKVTFRKVNVVPQGVGALVKTRLQNDPSFPIVAIADIGSCTTDVPVLMWHDDKEAHVYNSEASFSDRELNTNLAVRIIRQKLKGLPGCGDREFAYHDIVSMMRRNRYIVVNGSSTFQEDRIKPIFDEAKKEFTRMFEAALIRRLKPELWATIDKLVIAGGGVYFIDKQLWEYEDRSIFLDEWANAVGQWEALN
jgi:hypothetical protein